MITVQPIYLHGDDNAYRGACWTLRIMVERDRQLRRYLAPYSAEAGVDGAEKMALVVLLNLTLKRDRVESLCDEGLPGNF